VRAGAAAALRTDICAIAERSRCALFGKEPSRRPSVFASKRSANDDPEVGRVLDRKGVVFENLDLATLLEPVYQVIPTLASWATSLRRKPGVRRRAPCMKTHVGGCRSHDSAHCAAAAETFAAVRSAGGPSRDEAFRR
jgi:hypothetical protein